MSRLPLLNGEGSWPSENAQTRPVIFKELGHSVLITVSHKPVHLQQASGQLKNWGHFSVTNMKINSHS